MSDKTSRKFQLPDLVEIQKNSYDWFWEKGLRDLLDEVSPITPWGNEDLELHFLVCFQAFLLLQKSFGRSYHFLYILIKDSISVQDYNNVYHQE